MGPPTEPCRSPEIREGCPMSRGFPASSASGNPFCYRCFFDKTYPECNLFCADQIREVIEVEGPKTIAGIIVEPITGSNCRIIPPDGYMQRLRQICDEYKILLIADEVMTGFGRTGKMVCLRALERGSGYHDPGQGDQQCRPSPWGDGGEKTDRGLHGRPHVLGRIDPVREPDFLCGGHRVHPDLQGRGAHRELESTREEASR